jgi:hypothetical protein
VTRLSEEISQQGKGKRVTTRRFPLITGIRTESGMRCQKPRLSRSVLKKPFKKPGVVIVANGANT